MSSGSFQWLCSNSKSFEEFVDFVRKEIDFKKPLHIECKVGFKRSLGQNALFHKWCGMISVHLRKKGKDFTADEVKTYLKRRFGERLKKQDIDPSSDAMVGFLKSTADYTVGEMYHFMNACFEFGAEIGVTLSVEGEYADLLGREVA